MKYYSSFQITAENSLNNRAINYGDGLFETMHVKNRTINLWPFHCQRLMTSLKKLDINPLNANELRSNVQSLITDNQSYVLKLVVFRDDKSRGYSSRSKKAQYFMTLNPYIKTSVSDELTVSPIKLSHQNTLAGIKHLNRLEQVLASQQLLQTDYSDAIMCDQKDRIIETTNKNIILFKNNKIYSPKLNKSGVHGVALSWLQSQGHKIFWKKIEYADLHKYHGMMVCNSIQGFKSIKKVGSKILFSEKLNIAKKIKEQWKKSC
ncbi:MAG: aminodeoxychorismate lyase [Marinicellaceae bacterium]